MTQKCIHSVLVLIIMTTSLLGNLLVFTYNYWYLNIHWQTLPLSSKGEGKPQISIPAERTSLIDDMEFDRISYQGGDTESVKVLNISLWWGGPLVQHLPMEDLKLLIESTIFCHMQIIVVIMTENVMQDEPSLYYRIFVTAKCSF